MNNSFLLLINLLKCKCGKNNEEIFMHFSIEDAHNTIIILIITALIKECVELIIFNIEIAENSKEIAYGNI